MKGGAIMVSLIVAQATNRAIGKDNRVPWRLPADLARLKRLTKDQVTIIGHKTYESMDEYYKASGREMPARKYLVVTRDDKYKPDRHNATVVFLLEEALQEAKRLKATEVFVMGGSSVYKEALPLVGRIYQTRVLTDFEGDAFFPKLKPSEWMEVSRELRPADEKNQHAMEFLVLERVI